MRFSGYWVSSDQEKTEISVGEFDDTELSDHSGWQKAWQNADPDISHGFIDPLDMLHEVSKRISGAIDPIELANARTEFESGAPFAVKDQKDFATFIQIMLPKIRQ